MRETVTVIEVNGASRKVDYPETLYDWQGLVGGLIEAITVDKSTLLIVNEEGMLEGLRPNFTAMGKFGRTLLGPVVVVEGAALKRWRSDR